MFTARVLQHLSAGQGWSLPWGSVPLGSTPQLQLWALTSLMQPLGMAWDGIRTPIPEAFLSREVPSPALYPHLWQMRAGRETEAQQNKALQLAGGGAGAMGCFVPPLLSELDPSQSRRALWGSQH